MLKHPLLPVTLCHAAGILAAAWLEPPLAWTFVAAYIVLVAALAGGRFRPLFLGLLLFVTGVVNLTTRTAVLAPHDLRRLIGEDARLVNLRGRLAATPTLRVSGDFEEGTWRTLALVDVDAGGEQGQWQPAAGRVAVSTPGVLGPEFFGGRTVELFGVLQPPRPPRAPGLFDARAYFRWQGIYYQLEAETTNDWRLAEQVPQPARPPLADRFNAWARHTLARGLPAEDESLRLLRAMTLGWRTALTEEVSLPFMRTGTMHVFAISGLHIALIAGMLVALLRVLQVPRAATGLVVVPLIWFYTAATGWQASAIRSTIMMTVVIAGWALRRPGDLLNSLAGSALLILLWDPRQLFQASFQLSFFVVLSMALLVPPLTHLRDRLLRHDPLLPDELLPRWRRVVDPPLRWLTLSLAVSLAAWVGSLPLIAHYFHLVTPVGLLANLVIVPLSSLALMSNLGALLCGGWLPALTVLFNHAAWLWMELMVRACGWAASLPGAFFAVPAPGAVWTAAFYGLLVLFASGWLRRPERRRRAWAGAGICGAILIGLPLLPQRDVTITCLPLNGGTAIWINQPGRRHDLLLDCGNDFNAVRVTQPFLQSRGLNRLPNLVLTHGDARHTGGALGLAGELPPERIWTSPVDFRSPSYREFLGALAQLHGEARQLARGDSLAGWRVLHPAPEDAFPRADDNALVLRGELAGMSVLLLSDLGPAGQAALREREPDLRADLVVAGLPDTGEALEPALLAVLQPRLILVTDDERPYSAQAKAGLRGRLKASGVPAHFTSELGAVTLRLGPHRCWLESLRRGTMEIPPPAPR